MHCLEHSRDRYLRTPHLEATADGGALLHAIAWDQKGECLVRYALDAKGVPLGAPTESEHAPALAGLRVTDTVRIGAADERFDQSAERGGWRALIEHDRGYSTLKVRTPQGKQHVIWQALGIATAPYIVPAQGGAWVAFHHDVREDDNQPDVAKWIALRFVDLSGAVFEIDAPMLERDRDREGVEQSFEFPSLVVEASGALTLFGRGSHNFYRQRITREGFGPREALSDGAWGCRGRRIAAVMLADDAILSARRERKGIVTQRFDAIETGGTPPLKTCDVKQGQPTIVMGEARNDWRGPQILFGDIHQHSAHSDGVGTVDEVYLRGRYRYSDDFAALTDHESFLGKRIGPGEWAYIEAVTEAHHAPGEFVTLNAYEWTGKMFPGPGHKCVYLNGPGQRIISRDEVPEGKEIVKQVAEQGGFAVPHHVGWTGANAEAHDPLGQPVWEICSCHGCYECTDHPLGQRGELKDQLAQEMLRKGLRFGFIACSDSHGLLWHHGVARKRDPFRTGLTAVISEERTREGILNAIRARRCYATSGEKIWIDVQAGGKAMGSIIKSDAAINFSARVAGTNVISKLEWVGPEGVLASSEPGTREASFSKALHAAWIYLRVTQANGEMAWTSPVFLDPE